VLTNDTQLAGGCALLKNIGIQRLDAVQYIGINAKDERGRPPPYGLSLLPFMPATIARAAPRLMTSIALGWGHTRDSGLFRADSGGRGNGQYLPVFVDEEFGLGRDHLWAYLWDAGIQTRPTSTWRPALRAVPLRHAVFKNCCP